MGKSKQPYLRSENGKREVADTMHSKYNKQLQCPACDFECSTRGAFNKDSGGTPDKDGRLYTRFKCRAHPRCRKTLGVTELLDLCQKLLSTTSLYNLVSLTSLGTSYLLHPVYYFRILYISSNFDYDYTFYLLVIN